VTLPFGPGPEGDIPGFPHGSLDANIGQTCLLGRFVRCGGDDWHIRFVLAVITHAALLKSATRSIGGSVEKYPYVAGVPRSFVPSSAGSDR